MEKILISTYGGVKLHADKVKILNRSASLQITVAHKNRGDSLDKVTSYKLAEEIAEWLIKREGCENVEILK